MKNLEIENIEAGKAKRQNVLTSYVHVYICISISPYTTYITLIEPLSSKQNVQINNITESIYRVENMLDHKHGTNSLENESW